MLAPNSTHVADVPDQLSLAHHRDLRGRERRPIVRWVLLSLLGLLCLLALANVFGQRPSTDTAESAVVRLDVYSPPRLRSGLIFESRFHIHARREIREATLVLDPGWLEGMTLNTVAPGPDRRGEPQRPATRSSWAGSRPAASTCSSSSSRSTPPTSVTARRTSSSTTARSACWRSTGA